MARSLLRRRSHLGFCHYERSEVIKKQVLLAMRLLELVSKIASPPFGVRNDKSRVALLATTRLSGKFARNDKKHMVSSIALPRTC
jgi:hypothetical protein